MKRQISIFLSVLFLAVVFGSPVIAQQDNSQGRSSSRAEINQETLAARKQALEARLTEVEKQRLAERCQASQEVLSKIAERFNIISQTRAEKYNRLMAKLDSVSAKLKNNQIDTTKLDESIKETQGLIDVFTSLMEANKVELNNLTSAECAEDVVTFKAGLDTIKDMRTATRQASEDIRNQVKGPVKTELQAIRAQIEAATADDSTEPSTSDDATTVNPDQPVSNEEVQ